MILITIDELQGDKQKQIEEIAGEKTYVHYLDKEIPYEEIEIMITYGLESDWEVLEHLPNLKWIQIFQTGIEHVPLRRIKEKGIKITNVRDIYGPPMAEYVMSLILHEVRDIQRFIENKRLKRYDREQLVDEVNGKTIGIFGTGAIGTEVAKKAQAFDMNVYGFNTDGRSVPHFDQTYTWQSKEELISECDFIVLLLPLMDDTYHFLKEREFNLMKEEAFVINIGRGPLIKEMDLLQALKSKKIKGAALDVFDVEPLPTTSPLWDAERLVLTPHLSGKTKYFFDRSIAIFKGNYEAFTENATFQYVVDVDKGY